MTGTGGPAIILLTGVQAAGKSTVAQLLAEQLPRSVHVRGDLFRRMIVNGRSDMVPDPPAEAVAQLRLRYRLTAATCDAYFRDGFTVIAQDVILGGYLPRRHGPRDPGPSPHPMTQPVHSPQPARQPRSTASLPPAAAVAAVRQWCRCHIAVAVSTSTPL